MSYSAADLVATIQLGGADSASRDLDRFRGKLENADSVASKLGKTADATFRAAATGIGVASVAAAAYVTNLFSTGVAYNTLQQTSRAALKTLVGGAEQANAQMDKLDAFAKKSPFSKSVFITAQQQLIGFGMQAEKVIPTLDAMQDAVAAVGGSNQQLGDLVFILAQIQAAGKITGQDLLQFGQRGVDAATLIGSQMGLTGAQIKEEITAGTLDATVAVDALVAGMKQKFAGASANVKETFTGTVDRIRAASRDIGAALAEPFVSKNGGGLAVGWGNQVADVMRSVESHVAPVVSILTARAAPAFASITELLDRARVNVRAWDSSSLEAGLDAMADHAPAIAAVAGAVLGVNSQLLASIPIVGRFVPSFGPLAGALAGAAAASPALRKELAALLGELKPLVPVTVQVANVASGALNAALPVVASGIKAVTSVAGPLVDIIDAIPAPMLATAAAGVAVFMAMREGTPAIQGFVDGIRRIQEQAAVQSALAGMGTTATSTATGLGAMAKAAEGTSRSVSTWPGVFGAAGRAVTGVGASLKAAFISNPVGWIILGVSTAATLLTAALSAQAEAAKLTRERVTAYRDTLVEATGEMTYATREVAEAALETKTSFLWYESSTVGETARQLGLRLETVTQAMLGNADAMALVKTAMLSDDAAREVSMQNLQNFEQTVTSYAEASRIAAEEVRAKAEAERRAASAMTDLERSNVRMNEALAIARDVSADATSRLNALKQALDELRGGTRSQADLTQELDDRTRSLGEAFNVVDESGTKLADSLVLANGQIDTQTAAGSALRTQLSGLRDDYLGAMKAAYDAAVANGANGVSIDQAREIHERYATRLEESARAAGVAEEKIGALVGAMLEAPEVISYAFTDDGSVDAEKMRVLDLAMTIMATPDGSFNIQTEDIPGLLEALRVLGVSITTLPDGTVSVHKDGASFASVEEALNSTARDRTARIFTRVFGGEGSDPGGRYATGGPVFGPGSSTSDSIPAYLSNDEHVWTAAETRGAGGHGQVAMLRQLARSGRLGDVIPGFAEGGSVYSLRDSALPSVPLAVRSASPSHGGSGSMSPSDSRVLALLERIAAGPDGASAVVQLLERIAMGIDRGATDRKADAWSAAQL